MGHRFGGGRCGGARGNGEFLVASGEVARLVPFSGGLSTSLPGDCSASEAREGDIRPYTDTWVAGSSGRVNYNGDRSSGASLAIEIATYKFDSNGDFSLLSITPGFAVDATVQIDRQLTAASASASIPVSVCTYPEGEEVCVSTEGRSTSR